MAATTPPHGKETRRQFSPEEKVRILRLHPLLEGQPVSVSAKRRWLHPTLFSRRQRAFFGAGEVQFIPKQAEIEIPSRAMALIHPDEIAVTRAVPAARG